MTDADAIERRLERIRRHRFRQKFALRGRERALVRLRGPTATCCRNCLARNHGIAKGHELTPDELGYVVDVVWRWIELELGEAEEQLTLG